jgi:hypothetical protein
MEKKRACSVIPCAILLAAFCATPGCTRGQKQGNIGPSAAEQKAFAATIVGTYGVKPDPGLRPYSPPPKITLSPDGNFSMESIPSDWVTGCAAYSEKTFAAKGNWKVGDDGDGSWEIFIGINDVNGRTTSKSFRLRPFGNSEKGIMFDGPDTTGPNLIRTSAPDASGK